MPEPCDPSKEFTIEEAVIAQSVESEHGTRPERRQNVRHQYHPRKRPTLEIKGKTFPILDISERSLRIEPPLSMRFVVGETVDMTIRFADGEELARSGTIVRMQDTHICVGILLSKAIPLADFFRE